MLFLSVVTMVPTIAGFSTGYFCYLIPEVALISLVRHSFVRPIFCYYSLKEFKLYQQGKSSSGIIFVRSFIQIHPVILDM